MQWSENEDIFNEWFVLAERMLAKWETGFRVSTSFFLGCNGEVDKNLSYENILIRR